MWGKAVVHKGQPLKFEQCYTTADKEHSPRVGLGRRRLLAVIASLTPNSCV